MNTTTAAIVSDSIAASWAADSAATGVTSSFDEDFDRGDYRRSASNVSSSTTIVTDPDSPVEDLEEDEDEDFLEEDDGDTYEDGGAEIFKCHDDDDDDAAYNNVVRNDNDDDIHSTMMWHHVRQDQAGHEIDCEAFSSDSSEEEADDEEEFGDDDDDDDAEEGIELKEDEQQDEGDLSDSGDDGNDEHHDVDDISIDEDEDDDDYGSSQEYETDEDSLDDANECDPTMVDVDDDDDGASSNASSSLIGPRPNHLLGNGASQRQQQHELFLPVETAPTIESLKYEEEDDDDESNSTDDSSSNEDDNDDVDDDDDDDDTQLYPQQTYIIEQNNRNSGRPRMWDGSYNAVKPPLPSISSSLSRSSSSSLTSKKRHKFKESCSIANAATATNFSSRHLRRRSGVTFNNSVTVYPIFKTSVYTPTMILALYTQRDELRVNKLRNKREYAYEDYDWRNVVEEIDMTYSPSTGSSEQLVHPVHATTTTTTKDKTVKSSSNSRSPSPRNVVQTYSSAFGGYINGSSMTSSLHGAKRMRMYYP